MKESVKLISKDKELFDIIEVINLIYDFLPTTILLQCSKNLFIHLKSRKVFKVLQATNINASLFEEITVTDCIDLKLDISDQSISNDNLLLLRIQEFTNLEIFSLKLKRRIIYENFMETIMNAVSATKINFLYLDFTAAKFTEGTLIYLRKLTEIPSLRKLSMNFTCAKFMRRNELIHFAELRQCKNLSDLHISISYTDYDNIADGLVGITNMDPENAKKMRRLSMNMQGAIISRSGLEELLKRFRIFENIEVLSFDLDGLFPNKNAVKSLIFAKDLKKLKKLSLSLESCDLGDREIEMLSQIFPENKQLGELELSAMLSIHLKLNSNKIQDEGLEFLANRLGNLLNLESVLLEMRGNRLKCDRPEILNAFTNSKKKPKVILDIRDNGLTNKADLASLLHDCRNVNLKM